jgi:hypothetical protein
MRLLAYGLLIGFFTVGCSSGTSGLGVSSGAGGYGGAMGTTGSWTSPMTTGGAGGYGFISSGGSSDATTSSTVGGTGGTSSTSGSSSSTSGTGGSATSSSGDCESSSDCTGGGQCVAVTPGGYLVCLAPPAMATTCTSLLDQCCPTTNPCPDSELCYQGPLVPVCAGTLMAPHNQCAVDQCSQDADCTGAQICALAGTFGLEIRACVAAYCKLDTDCTAHAGGLCAPAQDPCCSAYDGLFCVYPDDGGCRSNADCPAITGHPSRYCMPDPVTGIASCQDGGPVCPA